MSNVHKLSAADLFKRHLARTARKGQPVPDGPPWYETSAEMHRRNTEIRNRQEAQRQAEAEARKPRQSTAGVLHDAIKRSAGNPLPLNGAGVLLAALGGSPGTINGDNP